MSLAVALSIGTALLGRQGGVRRDLDADYALFTRAWSARNLEPTFKLMTDDFVAIGVDPSGKPVGRKQMIVNTKQLLVATNITWPRHILKVDRHGDQAEAIVEGHFTGMMPGRNGSKARKFEIIATTKDTWTFNGKLWKFKRMEILKSTMKIDGKVTK